MNEIVTVISSVGFPIVACIGCGYYINSTIKEMMKVVQDNTITIQRLIDKLDKGK